MAYVPVPKDLTKVKTKVAFNLTKRQLSLPKSGSGMIAAAPSHCLISWCGKVTAPDRAAPFPRQPGQKV